MTRIFAALLSGLIILSDPAHAADLYEVYGVEETTCSRCAPVPAQGMT
jgi:hypothetical protein